MRGGNRPRSAIRDRLIKETDFAFRQAFAFCPYSPEAVFRYCQLLLSLNRVEDARLVAETCRKLDPYNAQVVDLVKRLEEARTSGHAVAPATPDILAAMEQEVAQHPTNFQTVLNLAANYMGLGQTGAAMNCWMLFASFPGGRQRVLAVLRVFFRARFSQMNGAERLVQLSPTQPEACTIGAIKAFLARRRIATAVRQALPERRRLKTDGQATRFAASPQRRALLGVHANAEFQAYQTKTVTSRASPANPARGGATPSARLLPTPGWLMLRVVFR